MASSQATLTVPSQNPESDLSKEIRDRALDSCKDFKTSWTQLGQLLYAIHEDKLYHAWGYEKFEHYTKQELGFKKQVALKMLKSYLFVEGEQPAYLDADYADDRDGPRVPSLEEINVLRMAKGKKELNYEDFKQLKKSVFDKGKDASVVRKELTAMMKERKPVDPEAERESRNMLSIKKMIESLRTFQKDMETLKMVPHDVIEEASTFLEKLKKEVG